MLVHFKGKKFGTTTINKKDYVPLTMETGQEVMRPVNSGIVDKVITHYEEYYIPEEQICMKKTKNGYFICDIEVDEEEFNKVFKGIGAIDYGTIN